MENTPVNAAHAFANAAEELGEKEQWGKAMEAHFRAAEQYALAMNYTSDPEAIRTLKLLYTNHTRQGKDIQRRLSKQAQQSPKSQEKLNPPSLNRTKRSPSSTNSKSNANNQQVKQNSEQRIQQNQSKQGSILSVQPTAHSNSFGVQTTPSSNDRLLSDHSRTTNDVTLEFASGLTSSRRDPILSDSATSVEVSRTNIMTSSTTPSVMDGSSDSEKTIEESYMMLKGANDTDEDDSDPFNKFWDIVEGLVQKISNPVAFATVPLNDADSRTTFDPNTIQSSLPFRYNTYENIVDDSKVEELNAAMMESFYIIPKDQKSNLNSRTGGLPQSLSTSSQSTSSDSKNSTTKTIEEYSIENKQLKAIIDNMSKRMLTYEKAAEENNMLKSSILQFKNDFQKQAKRIKVSQEMLRSSSIVKQTSPESSTVGNQRRIKELEEENRLLRTERDKQQELATKYKDRWEKLKESAKKKRVNKQAEVSPLSPSENSSESNSTITSFQQSEHSQNTSSPTLSKQSQTVQPLQQFPSSPSGTKLPFALQKPQRLGVGGILDDPLNLKNNNVQRHTAPLTTTILHATSTGPNKLNADRTNSSDGIEELLPTQLAFLPPSQQDKQVSLESIIPPISSVTNPPLSTRRESAPTIQIFDNSASNSITASNPTSQSMYYP